MDVLTLFHEQLDRIRCVTDADTQNELALILGVDLSEVTKAQRNGKIPSHWLAILLVDEYVLPEWILTGQGPCYADELQIRYENPGADAALPQADQETTPQHFPRA